MSLLTKPENLKEDPVFLGLIYGQPGIGKTTLALSSPNPVLLDYDRGLKRVQPQFRVPSLQVDTHQQVIDLINSGEVDAYSTIVADTLGKAIDKICDHVAIGNPKLRQSDGQMSQKGWGAVKNQFQTFLKLLRSKNKSILFVAHESEEKDGDDVKKRPDCTGSARKDIVKELDFMGYMEMSGGKHVISFMPTEKFYAKNSYGLGAYLEVPDPSKSGNNFIAREIVKLSQDRLVQQAEMRSSYESLIKLIEGNIAELNNPADFNLYYSEMSKKEVIWDSAMVEKRNLSEKAKSLGIVFDKETRQFIQGQNAVNNTIAA